MDLLGKLDGKTSWLSSSASSLQFSSGCFAWKKTPNNSCDVCKCVLTAQFWLYFVWHVCLDFTTLCHKHLLPCAIQSFSLASQYLYAVCLRMGDASLRWTKYLIVHVSKLPIPCSHWNPFEWAQLPFNAFEGKLESFEGECQSKWLTNAKYKVFEAN